MTEITGGSPVRGRRPWPAATAQRQPTANELAIARFQGRHVAEITKKLVGARGIGFARWAASHLPRSGVTP